MSGSARFQQVEAIFRDACHLSGPELQSFLDDSCGTDDALRREVRELLEADDVTQGVLDGAAVAAVAPNGPPPPEVIGQYRIVRTIGRGGMGTVYEGRQQNPRRIVAVKVMKHGIASRSALRRFEYEAQILGRLRHPGIAQVYEAGTHEDQHGRVPFFAMEYVPNARTILEHATARNLDLRARLQLFIDVCVAVHHGHQRGIIHRDLKPANILVDSTGQPRIIDFGVARATDSDLAVTTMQTDVGQLIGTLQYMSPEQCDADPHDLDVRSDVYALGIILYELLCRALPYEVGPSVYQATRIIRETLPSRPSTIRRELRGDLETITLKAIEKDRTRRYASALDLADDLRRYLDDQPIEARPPSIVYQGRMFARRNRALVAAAVAILLVLVAGSIVSAVFAIRAAEQRDAARDAEARAQRRFDDVRQLANTLLFDLDNDLRTLPGSTAMRERLVQTGLAYLDRLAAEPADADAVLLGELANAYLRIGDIQGNPRLPNLGRTDEAMRSYEKSLELRLRVPPSDRDTVPYKLGVANAERKIGILLSYLGQHDAMLERYLEALRWTEEAAALTPEDPAVQRDLMLAHAYVGEAHRDSGRLDEALARFRRSLALAAALAEADPESDRAQRDRSICQNDVGDALTRMGRADEAIPYFEASLESRRRIAEAHPDDARAQRDLFIGYTRIGNVHSHAGDPEAALVAYRDAERLAQRLADIDPENVAAIDALATIHEKVGNALKNLDRPTEALASYRRSAALRRDLVGRDPRAVRARTGLAVSLERIGDALRDLDRIDESLDHYGEAYEVAQAVVADDPSRVLAQTVRCVAAYKRAELLRERAEGDGDAGDGRDWREAARWYRRSLEVMREAEARSVRLLHVPVAIDALETLVRTCEAAGHTEAP